MVVPSARSTKVRNLLSSTGEVLLTMDSFYLVRDTYECLYDTNLTDVNFIVEKRKTGEHLAAKVVSTLTLPEERL